MILMPANSAKDINGVITCLNCANKIESYLVFDVLCHCVWASVRGLQKDVLRLIDKVGELEKKSHKHPMTIEDIYVAKSHFVLPFNAQATAQKNNCLPPDATASHATNENPSRAALEKKLSEKNLKIIALEQELKAMTMERDKWRGEYQTLYKFKEELANRNGEQYRVIRDKSELNNNMSVKIENMRNDLNHQHKLNNELQMRNDDQANQINVLIGDRSRLRESHVGMALKINCLEEKLKYCSCTALHGASNCK